jgi:hypothetical protein
MSNIGPQGNRGFGPTGVQGSTGNIGNISHGLIGSQGNTGGLGSQGNTGGLGSQGNTGGQGWIGIEDEKIKERVIKEFIWKPTKLKKRWKWLTYTYIKQHYKQTPLVFWDFTWINIEFLSYSEYLEWRIVNE